MSKKNNSEPRKRQLNLEESLIEDVKEKSNEVKATRVTYSIRELRSMFEGGDINIQPEFQRIFRWTEGQRSSLIESLLLSIPLPSIFVSESDDGTWEVIDGVQRLSTIFGFMGLDLGNSEQANGSSDSSEDEANTLNDELDVIDSKKIEVSRGFPLTKMEYLRLAEGLTWGDLPRRLKKKIETTGIDVTQIANESSNEAKYNLFLRLNSGSTLSAQELRNGMLVMINKNFFKEMKNCSSYEPFKLITQVSNKKREEAFQDELVLRFFFQAAYQPSSERKSLKNDFGDELTQWAKKSASTGGERGSFLDFALFKEVVDLVLEVGGEDVLRKYDKATKTRKGPVSNAAFEFVMAGLAENWKAWKADKGSLAKLLKDFWDYPPFANNKGSGINARDRLPEMVANGRKFFHR